MSRDFPEEIRTRAGSKERMARLVLYMSMSLDGFIAGPGDNKDNPFGTRGHRLHKWLGDGGADVSGFRPSDEPSRTVFDEMISTGAVITGRRTGDFVDYWGGDHHDGVPIFVPTPRRAQLPHELRDGGTGLVGAVLLDEMDSADGQVGPRADEASRAGAARQLFRAPGETFRIADPKASTSAATPNPKDVKSGGVLVNRRLGSARREVLAMAAYDLAALWEAHCRYEFETRDVDATMSTMVAEPYVNHIPTMTGGVGFERLRHFYAHHFVGVNPPDFELVAVSRTVGESSLVDEFIVRFTHTTRMDWMLPGIEPTGRAVEIPTVAIVRFQEDKLVHEHIYWDQASVLVQLGLLDPDGLPIAGAETARKVLNASLPSNTLMNPSQ